MNSMMQATCQFGKDNMSVVSAFRKQLQDRPKKPCFYFEDKIWTYEDVCIKQYLLKYRFTVFYFVGLQYILKSLMIVNSEEILVSNQILF